MQSKWKSIVVNVAISRDFGIRIQTFFQPAKTVKFNPSRCDLTTLHLTFFIKLFTVLFWAINLVSTDLEIQNMTSKLLSKEFVLDRLVLDNFKDESNTKSWHFSLSTVLTLVCCHFFRLAYSETKLNQSDSSWFKHIELHRSGFYRALIIWWFQRGLRYIYKFWFW